MRSTRLLSVVAAATATTLALAPVVASARPASATAPGGHCRVHVEVPRGPVTAEQPVTIFGQLKCPAEGPTGEQVVLYDHAAINQAGFTPVATPVTTEKGGYFQFTSTFTVNTSVYVTAGSARSAPRKIRVAPVVTLLSPTEGTPLFTATGRQRKIHSVTFTGTVSPFEKGSTVVVQREESSATEEWHRVGEPEQVKEGGKFELKRNFTQPGVANLRVVVHQPRGLGAAGASAPASFVFSQPQNPGLTIQASVVGALSYGQSTTISGKVEKAAGGTPVTLLARTPHEAHFATVETAKTVGETYSFTQTPLHNTLYKVVANGHTSALLAEGVKFAVTAAAPPSTFPAGTTETFTGTVKGAKPGDPVYLERKSPSEVGYNLSEEGKLRPGATSGETTYSIERAFYGAGEADIRVLVPGDGEHLSKASEPSKVTITSSPASTLHPEAAGNGALSREPKL